MNLPSSSILDTTILIIIVIIFYCVNPLFTYFIIRIFLYNKIKKNLYFVQVIRENMKDFLIFLDFLKILNLAMNKLLYLDLDIYIYNLYIYLYMYIYYVHYAVDP